MSNLMLHCGSDAVQRHELAALPVPAPMGPRHVVRPFIEDVEIVSSELAKNGLTLVNERYGVLKGEDSMPKRFFGLMELEGSDEFSLTVGLRGAYDQSLPRGLAIGSNIFVCDNLAFGGEIVLNTKQTTNIGDRLPQMLRDAVARIPGMAHRQEERFAGYRDHNVVKRIGDAMLVEMVRRGILNGSQLPKALAEWDRSSHEEHEAEGYTLWKLHNAVTEALKPANPEVNAVQRNWGRTIDLTAFLDDAHENGFRVYN